MRQEVPETQRRAASPCSRPPGSIPEWPAASAQGTPPILRTQRRILPYLATPGCCTAIAAFRKWLTGRKWRNLNGILCNVNDSVVGNKRDIRSPKTAVIAQPSEIMGRWKGTVIAIISGILPSPGVRYSTQSSTRDAVNRCEMPAICPAIVWRSRGSHQLREGLRRPALPS